MTEYRRCTRLPGQLLSCVVGTEHDSDPETSILLRPDFVIKNESGLHIVDVTVRYEQGKALEEATIEKIAKYTTIREEVASVFDFVGKVSLVPLVFGSRGSIPITTVQYLRKFGIASPNSYKITSMICLRSSLDIVLRRIEH